jgi:hypothetical protein
MDSLISISNCSVAHDLVWKPEDELDCVCPSFTDNVNQILGNIKVVIARDSAFSYDKKGLILANGSIANLNLFLHKLFTILFSLSFDQILAFD